MVTRFDPLSYIVDPMRHAVFSHLSTPGAATASIAPGITWNGWEVPDGLSLGIVAVIGVAMLFLAIAQFRKTE